VLVRDLTVPLLEQLAARPQSSRDLARELDLDKGTLGQELGRLVARGLVIANPETDGARYAARDPGLLEAAGRLVRLGPVRDHPRLLGDPTPLLLLELIGRGECTVTQLAAASARSHQNVSRHLCALYALRLIDRMFERNRFVYSLGDRTVLQALYLIAGPPAARERESRNAA
jgi:DNA-binding transcriptional ArsR family regulator